MNAEELAFEAGFEYQLKIAAAVVNGDTDCAIYLRDNRLRILPRLMLKQQKYGGDMADIVAEFIRGVHTRHSSGLPLS